MDRVRADWGSYGDMSPGRTCQIAVIEIGIERVSYGHSGHRGDDRVRPVRRHRHDGAMENDQADNRLFSEPGPFLGHRIDLSRREHQRRAGSADLVSALVGRALVVPSSSAFY